MQETTLPTDMFGRILDTNKNAKGKRMKTYFVNSVLDISALEIFTIVGVAFGKDEFMSAGLNLVNNATINNVLNYIIGFLIGVVVFFTLEYVINETKIKKYNKTGRK